MIRPMTEADLVWLEDAEKDLFRSPWPADQYLYELRQNPYARLFVYEHEGVPAGYADLWIMFDQAQIATIGVLKPFQHAGIGSKLMAHCVREAVQEGCEYVSLEVRVSNEKAIGLYQKFGFLNAAVRKHYYDDGEDAYLMVLPAGGSEDDSFAGN